ncbi:MAG: hypothetical protein LBI48_02080 [Burkholderiaceae bacterium]|jgi:hypothetical protein|nr:hypothetical protein [Burkholderiaceae bacterium]
MFELKPTAIVSCQNGLVLDGGIACEADSFTVEVIPGKLRLIFTRVPGSKDTFAASGWLTKQLQVPCPAASLRGVWWLRRAAIEAQISFDAYRQAAHA